MQTKIKILETQLSLCDNEQKIIECKNIFIKEHLDPLYLELKKVDDKKTLGMHINLFKQQINEVVEARLMAIKLQSDVFENQLDNNIELAVFKQGKKHFINATIDLIINFFKKYNFEFINGDEIVSTKYNFDNLNIDENHVARNSQDTFFINEHILLRTHCTASTAKVLQQYQAKDDIRVLSYGNVYRKDNDDATHSHQFTQIDIVWIRKDFNLANLKFLIDELIKYLFGNFLKTRYRLSFFPFTEPSFEVDVQCINCLGDGCNICKQSGWIEVLGAGMLHQNVIKQAGIKDITTGLAAGIGIERIAMLKYNIKDIRDFYNNDFDFVKQCKE